jgi:hypothetical protein
MFMLQKQKKQEGIQMACFIVPAAEAVIVTAAAYATKKPEVKNTEK